jgi:protein-tyrosine phosphatase
MATLGLMNAANARDLGGFVTAVGRRTRRGVLYRANALNRLTDEDVLAVGRLGLVHVVDFRHPDEIEFTGPDRLPEAPACRVLAVPIFDPDHDVFTLVNAAIRGVSESRSVLATRLRSRTAGAAIAMEALYRWFVNAPAARESFATVVRLLAAAESLPLLFHCTAGKDRTGWLSAIVLSAVGVDRHAIVADYLRTNDLNAAGTAYILGQVGEHVEDAAALLLPLLEARLEYLEAAFDEADRVFGGMDGYLREGLGIGDEILEALHGNLLE